MVYCIKTLFTCTWLELQCKGLDAVFWLTNWQSTKAPKLYCCLLLRCTVAGVQLDAMSNGTSTTEYTGDTSYNPHSAAAAADQQQQSEGGTATPPPSGATAASSRPRRVIRAPERLINSAMGGYGGGERDDHDMVRCDSYAAGSVPGSGAVGAQPFRVQVTPL